MPGKIWRSARGVLSLPAPRQGVCKMAEENKAKEYGLLRRVSSPRELKKLAPEELHAYCDELRRYIIEECSVNPGHLASSLGAVELAAALHYVYDTPEDRIVWDVGHQTYAHKIITGRFEAFRTKRQLGGISGSAYGRERVRRLRRGACLGVDFGSLRHGQGRFAPGRAAQGGGRHRRRLDDRRSGLRGAEQRRGRPVHRPAGDSQRQPHGHRPGYGGAEELPAQDLDLRTLQPHETAAVDGPVAHAPAAASLPYGGERRQAGAAQQEQPLREFQFPLFRTRGRPRPRAAGADAPLAARHRGAEAAARDDGQGQGLPACRARSVGVACPGTLQSRHG